MSDTASSDCVGGNSSNQEKFDEPPLKKCKLSDSKSIKHKLEHRLEDILCCVVCLDLPTCSVHQCSNGHLMCAGCLNHLIADSLLRDEQAKCPTCRVDISKSCTSRNLAVEKALSELPADCRFCAKEYPRNLLTNHEELECPDRLTACKYQKIGCTWRGPFVKSCEHEFECGHPNRSGKEVMETLKIMHDKQLEELQLLENIVELMSFENIMFRDLQMRPYRTDEYLHKLFYETSMFNAGNCQWVIKARINNNNKSDPCESTERTMMYQLSMKFKGKPLKVHYLVVRGPYGDMKVAPKIYKFEFTENESESPYLELPLQDSSECNRLLASKVINFRLIMFIVS